MSNTARTFDYSTNPKQSLAANAFCHPATWQVFIENDSQRSLTVFSLKQVMSP